MLRSNIVAQKRLAESNRIMSVYVLLRTVVPRLLRAKVDDAIEGLPQVITCGPHVYQGIHYYALFMNISP